jgi:hypothetical protein
MWPPPAKSIVLWVSCSQSLPPLHTEVMVGNAQRVRCRMLARSVAGGGQVWRALDTRSEELLSTYTHWAAMPDTP